MKLSFEIEEAPDGSVTVHALRHQHGTRREEVSAAAMVEASERAGMPPRPPRDVYALPEDGPELTALLHLAITGP